MNTIKVNYRISNNCIINAIAEGKSLKTKNTIDVNLDELTKQQNKDLAAVLVVREGELTIDTSLDKDGVEGIIEYARKHALAEVEKYERIKKGFIEEVNDFIDGKIMRLEGTGIYSDKSGNFKFDELRKALQAQADKFKVEVDVEKIISIAEKYQAETDNYRAERKAKLEAEQAIKEAEETAKKAVLLAGRNELLEWAKDHGSELLKLRIKHEQNWLDIAEEEWAVAHCKGFAVADFDEDESWWTVKNANIDQLRELEKAKSENTECEIAIIRVKFVDNEEDDDEAYHRTFLRVNVKTPAREQYLYKEISNAADVE